MIRAGSIVTAMTRNGNMFGIRVSGLGDSSGSLRL